MGKDWVDWHNAYDDPGSPLRSRLLIVQRRIREALDEQSPGPINVISMCAGQGRDLFGALAGHPRRPDVRARMVELDPANVAVAERAAGGLAVDVIAADAGWSSAYQGAIPADIALVCGVFGNITDQDIRRTVEWLPRLCRTGATVIWTRHRRAPDLTVEIRKWFAGTGFTEVAFDGPDNVPSEGVRLAGHLSEGVRLAGHLSVGVGTHRLTGRSLPFQSNVRLFEFVADKV